MIIGSIFSLFSTTAAIVQPAATTPDAATTRKWAQEIVDVFADGFQWRDIGQIIQIADSFLVDYTHLTLEERRGSIIAILNDFVDLTDTPGLPDAYTDTLFKAMIPPFVYAVITDKPGATAWVRGTPSSESIEQAARDVLDSMEDGIQWEDLAKASQFAMDFASRYHDLTPKEKAGVAKEVIDFIIDNTDTPYLIDSIADPIFKEMIHPLVDIYFGANRT